jgi:hypothetical protein
MGAGKECEQKRTDDMIKDTLAGRLFNGAYTWISEYYYRNNYKRRALKTIEKIERTNSLKLSPKIKKMADDYAIQVFGKKECARWFYLYSLLYGKFTEGWIPVDFYERFVSPIRGKNMATCYKTLTNVILKTEALPDLAYYINGIFYGRDFTVIKISDVREIAGEHYTEVYVKKDYSMQGRGINKLDIAHLNEDTFKRIGNCVIQVPVRNHMFFNEIMPNSLSTIRITTVTNLEGKIEYRASFLRVGRKNDPWIQAGKEVDISIIDKDGELDPYGYEDEWKVCLSHPDTNFVFAKKRIPLFKEAVETCIKLHASVPHFRIIGWDIAISEDEKIRLLEWNGALTDVVFHQATTGPCFSGLNWEQLIKTKSLR